MSQAVPDSANRVSEARVFDATSPAPPTVRIVRREVPHDDGSVHPHPLARRVLLARGIVSADELRFSTGDLPATDDLPQIDVAVARLIAARVACERVLIVGDYDCDGATSTAVAVLGLRAFGFADVVHVVPNRQVDGYGLSPTIVRSAVDHYKPGLIVTVDNGIASVDGVAAARALGVDVIVTDHHLPPDELPAAVALVNPNLPDSAFPSGNLAGVGVIFFVLLALRRALAQANDPAANFKLATLLDLVAIGTVADVVPLDRVNRTLVEQGLRRIRACQTRPGVLALLARAGRDPAELSSTDIGFLLGPRINAAGRLDDMRIGIDCLLADDPGVAHRLAAELDALNTRRRTIEKDMRESAEAQLARLPEFGETGTPSQAEERFGLCLFDADWHSGVIGILAGRLKERWHRPVVVLAADGEELKGSARSIPGVHLRAVLQSIATRDPTLLVKFGGHAMAAGMTIERARVDEFSRSFDEEVRRVLAHRLPAREWRSDGALLREDRTLDHARLLARLLPWGQELPAPLFDGEFEVVDNRQVGQGHLKMTLAGIDANGRSEPDPHDAIAFGEQRVFAIGQRLRVVYALDANRYLDRESLQLMIRHIQPIDA